MTEIMLIIAEERKTLLETSAKEGEEFKGCLQDMLQWLKTEQDQVESDAPLSADTSQLVQQTRQLQVCHSVLLGTL